mmetsp:Transcript_2619/g.9247  ORF Transcript_2619/g.9247 Transcript_2619/m.9247 type:complete len:264 (+) Transcript_2619:543-1334(+)
MVALCTSSAPSVSMATTACPASCHAVSSLAFSLTTALALGVPITTRSLAASTCLGSMHSASSRAARHAAMLARFSSSAPLKPGVPLATSATSTSPETSGLVPKWYPRMSLRPLTSGSGTASVRSSLPGLVSAGSSFSGRLVAARSTTSSADSKPSSSVSSCGSAVPLCSRSASRLAPTASISSMNTTHGAFFFAAAKSLRILCAPTPTYFSSKDGPAAWKKGTPASPATARASRVLPVPGGPTMSMPAGSFAPRRLNLVGSLR